MFAIFFIAQFIICDIVNVFKEQLQKAIQEMQQKFGEKLYQNRKQQKLETIAKQYQQVVQNQKFNIFQQSMEEMNDKYSGYYHHQYTVSVHNLLLF